MGQPPSLSAFLPPFPKVTCVEVVEAYIERIKEVNPLINAVVKDR